MFDNAIGELEEIDLDFLDSTPNDNKSESSSDYPRLELEGVLLEEELFFIKDLCSQEPNENTLPLYIVFGCENVMAGNLDLDLDTVLKLNYLGNGKYTLKLMLEDNVVDLLTRDKKDEDVHKLLNFIRLRL